MNGRSPFRMITTAIAAFGLIAVAAPSAGASVQPVAGGTRHCVVEVVGQAKDGEYLLSEPECYSDYATAMASIGLGSDVTTPARAEAAAASVQSTLASHFDGAGYTGSSFSVSGVDCLGGYINMSAGWDNIVSSTFSWMCPRVRHWTGVNKTGSFQDTVPSGNLSSPVNNAVSSIQYLT